MRSVLTRSFGVAVPELALTNDDLSEYLETDDEWIKSRVGIEERRVVRHPFKDPVKPAERNGLLFEHTTELACQAAEQALWRAEIEPADIDVVTVATVSNGLAFPAIASAVQGRLKIPRESMAFDLVNGCAGFAHGVEVSSALLETQRHKRALLIGAEVLSLRLDWTDRGTAVLFGDAASAMVMEADESRTEPRGGVLASYFESDGEQIDVLQCWQDKLIKMDGKPVFKWAVPGLERTILNLLNESGKSIEDIDAYVLHQANFRIITDGVKRAIKYLNGKTDDEQSRAPYAVEEVLAKTPMTLKRFGNTSAASTGQALEEAWRLGFIEDGRTAMVVGYGAGGSIGAEILCLKGLGKYKS